MKFILYYEQTRTISLMSAVGKWQGYKLCIDEYDDEVFDIKFSDRKFGGNLIRNLFNGKVSKYHGTKRMWKWN